MARKKKNIETIKVNIPLEPADYERLGRELGELRQELRQRDAAFKLKRDEHKDIKNALEMRMDTIHENLHEGTQEEIRDCIVDRGPQFTRIFDAKSGQLLEERATRPEELQTSFDELAGELIDLDLNLATPPSEEN